MKKYVAYGIGAVSGCHINPAVSLGMVAAGRMEMGEAIKYIVAQVAGAIVAALVLLIIANGTADYSVAENGLGQNGWGAGYLGEYGFVSAFVFELVATFLFMVVILGATGGIGAALVSNVHADDVVALSRKAGDFDLGDEATIAAAVEAFGGLDVLVNSAGISGRHVPEGSSVDEAWALLMDPDHSIRDPQRALPVAQHAVDLASRSGASSPRLPSAIRAAQPAARGRRPPSVIPGMRS